MLRLPHRNRYYEALNNNILFVPAAMATFVPVAILLNQAATTNP